MHIHTIHNTPYAHDTIRYSTPSTTVVMMGSACIVHWCRQQYKYQVRVYQHNSNPTKTHSPKWSWWNNTSTRWSKLKQRTLATHQQWLKDVVCEEKPKWKRRWQRKTPQHGGALEITKSSEIWDMRMSRKNMTYRSTGNAINLKDTRYTYVAVHCIRVDALIVPCIHALVWHS